MSPAFGTPVPQPIDENVDQPKDVPLPTGLVVCVTHAHDRTQQVLCTDVAAHVAGHDRLL